MYYVVDVFPCPRTWEQVASDVWSRSGEPARRVEDERGPPHDAEFIVRNVVVAVAHASGRRAPIVAESGVVEVVPGRWSCDQGEVEASPVAARGARQVAQKCVQLEMSAAGSSGATTRR